MPAPSCLDHYNSLLAAHYTWMAGGDYGTLVADNRTLLARLGLAPGLPATRALDLGCGSGFQSAALLALGFEVTAVDLCAPLVAELRTRNEAALREGRLRTLVGNLLDAKLYQNQAPFTGIACMGDTLTHLQNREEVECMIAQAADVLTPGGRLVLRFRDLTGELTGLDRFIPVRADADKVMTCFLEYATPEHVIVTDLIYSQASADPASGLWRLEKSAYRKLRISSTVVKTLLSEHGLDIVHAETERNLITIVATKA